MEMHFTSNFKKRFHCIFTFVLFCTHSVRDLQCTQPGIYKNSVGGRLLSVKIETYIQWIFFLLYFQLSNSRNLWLKFWWSSRNFLSHRAHVPSSKYDLIWPHLLKNMHAPVSSLTYGILELHLQRHSALNANKKFLFYFNGRQLK